MNPVDHWGVYNLQTIRVVNIYVYIICTIKISMQRLQESIPDKEFRERQ